MDGESAPAIERDVRSGALNKRRPLLNPSDMRDVHREIRKRIEATHVVGWTKLDVGEGVLVP